jgi:hypothetical protein
MAATLTVYHQPRFILPFETIELLTSLPPASFTHPEFSYRYEKEWVCKLMNRQNVAKLLEARKDIGLCNYTACNMIQLKCSKLPAEKQISDNVRIRCNPDSDICRLLSTRNGTNCSLGYMQFQMLYVEYFVSPLHITYNLDAHAVKTPVQIQHCMQTCTIFYFCTHKLGPG